MRPRRLPRGWPLLATGAATSAVILGAWLPVGSLLSQRAAIGATTARLAQLESQGRSLGAAMHRLDSPVALAQLARLEYQLVAPGQRLLLVVTPSFRPSERSSGGPFPGDPGYSPLVDPVTGSELRAPGASSGVSADAARRSAQPGGGYFSRVLRTLEFWR